MGVRGLTSYIAKHSDQYLEPHELKDCYIVIDGNSLASQLYNCVSNCNCVFGGDYDEYANCVKDFFSLLKSCNVTSLVVFDGGYETRKLPTVHARLKRRLLVAKIITPVTQSKLKCFPLFMNEVFRNVLMSMQIRFVQSDFEADSEIAAIAQRLGCPVLSYDSDFYVYDVLYISFSTVILEPTQYDSAYDKHMRNHINCQIYNIEKFLDSHGGLDKSMLPVMAALLGNDYIEHQVFEHFLSQIQLPKNHSVSKTQRQIMGLSEWLRKETVETAVKKILNHVKKSQRKSVAKQLKAIIAGYSTSSSSLFRYLDISVEGYSKLRCNSVTATATANVERKDSVFHSICDSESDTNSHQSAVTENEDKQEMKSNGECYKPFRCGIDMLPQNLFPDWFKDNLHCGNLPRCFINMLVHQIHFSAPQVEDFSLPFSHRISLPILCVIFGLLTAGNATHKPELCYVAYKENAQPQTLIVLPVYGTASLNEFPPLEELPDLALSARRHLLYDAMGFNVNDILILEGFPDDWKIFIVALIYWGRNVSEPSLTEHHIHAVLFSIICLNIVDRHVGYCRSKKTFLKLNGTKLQKVVKLQSVKENEYKTGSGTFQSAKTGQLEMFENNLPSHKDISCVTVTEAVATVSSEDCFCLVETILPYHKMDECLKSRPLLFCVSVVHIFAQFQSCLLHVMHLNSLLSLPFIQCQVENFYSGTLIYNAYLNFKKHSDVEDYVLTQLLKCSPSVAGLYSTMVKLVRDFLPDLSVTQRKKKENKRKKKNDSKCYMNQY
ncbi:hypothetical protein B7P43_G06391 [Cryptotermes secundus]|nr:protein asteroid isoform X3 [Cryptotermes secundus]XP_033608996.1 protein asteroid isoform X3 [Cryptotermes secundus]PNF26061.1 hypothetical protein B7P43_G06391 [Cryptotermes secundus]